MATPSDFDGILSSEKSYWVGLSVDEMLVIDIVCRLEIINLAT
jgi:hypothetical protein